MTNSPPRSRQLLYLSQTLHSFFQTIGENREAIQEIFQQMRQLRQEYVKLIREDFILGLITTQKAGNIGDTLSRERLAILLEKLTSSFRSDQQKNYALLEQGLWQELLAKMGQQGLSKGFTELNRASQELQSVSQARAALAQEKETLVNQVKQLQQESAQLQEQYTTWQKKVEKLTEQVTELKNYQEACQDYQTMIREIRKEVDDKASKEGGRDLELWRLKILFNRVAALTKSSWNYPGIPKSDPFIPKSKHAQKFLDCLSQEPKEGA